VTESARRVWLLGMRKPDRCFYQHVLRIDMDGCGPEDVIYVDAKLENVLAAQELGMTAV
jgi:FMN phosphatase YigB (HAD superfamily)